MLPLVEEVAETCVRKTGDTMTGDLQMSGKRVSGLGSPQVDADAVTKAYAISDRMRAGEGMENLRKDIQDILNSIKNAL